MDPKKLAPLNLSVLLKKVFLFFCVSFVFFFAVFTIGQFFDFLGKQLAAFERQAVVLGEGLSITPDVLPLSRSGVEAPLSVEAPLNFVFTQKENSIEIQKLDVEVPMIFSKSADVKEVVKDLLRGVAVYPGSGFPGQTGRMFVLGHSAPPGFPKLKYYWVFSKLNDLETGDEIFINFEKKQYRYQVTKKMFLEKGQEIPETENSSRPVIYSITCWPPGKDFKRLVVQAILTSTLF